MPFNLEKIQKIITSNAQIIMIIMALVFMYILFYTDYIIINSPYSKVNDIKNEYKPESITNQNIQLQHQLMVSNENKHVKFDNTKNQEIVFENSNGRLNIDYQSPQLNELQKIKIHLLFVLSSPSVL